MDNCYIEHKYHLIDSVIARVFQTNEFNRFCLSKMYSVILRRVIIIKKILQTTFCLHILFNFEMDHKDYKELFGKCVAFGVAYKLKNIFLPKKMDLSDFQEFHRTSITPKIFDLS